MGQIVNDITGILNDKKSKKEAQNERQKILEQISADEAAKVNLVKKALATQRANFGAGGASGKSLSDAAVLRRLRDETEQPYEDKKKSNLEKMSKVKGSKSNNILKSLLSEFDALFS